MSYFVRLFSNLNESTIVHFLIPHLISVLGFLTAGMMLEYLGHSNDAARINAAVAACLTNDLITPELGGSLSTKEVGDAVLARL